MLPGLSLGLCRRWADRLSMEDRPVSKLAAAGLHRAVTAHRDANRILVRLICNSLHKNLLLFVGVSSMVCELNTRTAGILRARFYFWLDCLGAAIIAMGAAAVAAWAVAAALRHILTGT